MSGIDNMSRLDNILAVVDTREVFDWEQPNLLSKQFKIINLRIAISGGLKPATDRTQLIFLN